MEKRIFAEQADVVESVHQPKKEFTESNIVIEVELKEAEAVLIEPNLAPSRFWIRILLACLGLFGVAVIAQSVQWLVETWQAREWIYFAFSIVFFGVSLSGVAALVGEWRKLRALRKHHYQQQQSEQLLLDGHTSGENAVIFCKKAAAEMKKSQPLVVQAEQRWLAQLDEVHNSKEVLYLFSENVLSPLDQQVKKLITRSATENAVIVAISPLAVVDVLAVAWRNISLVNKISRVYGMELGYFSRLKLFKMVLTNMVFAGATEIATDLGSEFFTQNLTAKLSMRAAQGIGVGLLTARLGIQAMAFCRPIVFQKNERLTLSVVRQELLSALKTQVFSKSTEKTEERA